MRKVLGVAADVLEIEMAACLDGGPACLSGERNSSHVLYGRHNGHRFAVYVPEDLVGGAPRCRQ